MARVVDPATISHGGGLASRHTVEASSFVHPTQGLDGLNAHIEDPSRAHMASTIGITDAGGFFASDEVEDALQELATAHGATGQNGVVQGGTYTAVGLNVTLANPTYVIVGGTQRDLSGAPLALTDNQTNWLYVNGSTGVLAKLVGASPPSITSPENVLLAKITTAGGAITASRDARWFVKNLDRKLPLTVRSVGTEADRNSEASFESIGAAIIYLETFGVSGVMKTFTVVLKGAMTVSGVVTVPVDGVTFQGEDGCVITTGATLAPLFDISGRSNIKFYDMQLVAAHAASTAIGVTGSGALADITVERCTFSGTGGQQWVSAVDVNAAGPQSRVVIRNGVITSTSFGVRLREPTSARLENLTVTESGAAGTAAVQLGLAGGGINGTADCHVVGCTLTGFTTSVYLRSAQSRVRDCTLLNADTGVHVDTSSTGIRITDTSVSLDATTGLTGVLLNGVDVVVRGCQIENLRSSGAYAAQVPIGVRVASGTDSVAISDCTITNFLNTVTPGGVGVDFIGTSDQSVITSTTITGAHTGIEVGGATAHLRISGCSVSDTAVGLSVQGDTVVSDTTVQLSSTRAMIGVDVAGANVRIGSCRIYNARLSNSYLIGDIPTGIRIAGATKVAIVGSEVVGFYNLTGDLGACVGPYPATTSSSITVDGCFLETAQVGLDASLFTSDVTVTGTTISDVGVGISFGGQYNLVTGCAITASTTRGVTGVDAAGSDTLISNSTIVTTRGVYAGETPVGVSASAPHVKITGNRIVGWRNPGGSLGGGVVFGAGSGNSSVASNNISGCWVGVLASAAVSSLKITDNLLSDCDAAGVETGNSDSVSVVGNTIALSAASSIGVSLSNGVDLEVIGNKIDGGSGSSIGISLTGADVAADRVRRFVVSNNNIKAFTLIGIQLNGYVQNGIVSSNQVDGKLTAGDPSATACIEIGSSGTALVKYVEVVGNTLWRAKSGIVAAGVSYTALLTNLAISGNTIHHCAVGSAGTDPCAGISLLWVRDSDVSGNTIFKIGLLISDADVQSAPTAGANVYPYGVALRNTYAVSVSNNEVSNIQAAGAGVSCGVNLDVTGNAAVSPVVARTININGNRLLMDDGSTGFTTGISVGFGQVLAPGDTSSLFGLVVSGNTIRNMNGPGVILISGGGCTLSQVSVTGNDISTLTNASGSGVVIEALSSTDFTDGIVRGVEVSDNNIGNVAGKGVYVLAQTGCVMTGVTIRDNTVTTAGNRGIQVEVTTAPAEFSNLAILNNNVFGPTNNGIEVSIVDFAPTNIAVVGNTVTSATGGFAAAKGVVITTTEASVTRNDITGLVLSDNRILSTDEAIDVTVRGTLSSAAISRNSLAVNTNKAPIDIVLSTGTVLGVEAYSRDISLDANIMREGYGSRLLVSNGQKLSGLSFTGNKVYSSGQHGFLLQVDDATLGTNAAVLDVTLSDNTFDEVTSQALRILLGSAGVIDRCANITVKNNLFDKCNTTGTANPNIFLSSNCLVHNVAIEGNSFKECGNFDPGAATPSGIIELQLGNASGTLNTGENVSVSGNSFNDCSGPAVYLTSNSAATGWTIANLRIDGNSVRQNVYTAIYVDLESFTDARMISISGNFVDEVTGTDNDGAIEVYTPTAASVGQLNVCRNSVRTTGGGVSGAILVVVNDDASDLVVDGNTVEGDLSTDAAIRVSVEGLWVNGGVSGNTINTPTSAGIYVTWDGAAASSGGTGLTFSNNRISATGDAGIDIYAVDSTSSPALSGVLVSDNVLDTIGTYGIRIRSYLAASSLGQVVVSGNSIGSTSNHGLSIEASGSGALHALNISGNIVRSVSSGNGINVSSVASELVALDISNNNIYDVDQDGVSVSTSSDLRGVTLSNNHVRNWSQNAGGTVFGALHLMVLGDTDTVSVTGNSVSVNTEDNATGYWFQTYGDTEALVCSNNVTFMNNQAGTRSLYWEAIGATATAQAGVSLTGNTFRGAAVGVNYSASAGGTFAPDRSICAHNAERTGPFPFTGNWGSGGVGDFTFPFTNSIITNNQD